MSWLNYAKWHGLFIRESTLILEIYLEFYIMKYILKRLECTCFKLLFSKYKPKSFIFIPLKGKRVMIATKYMQLYVTSTIFFNSKCKDNRR